jgi:hypothetical protein
LRRNGQHLHQAANFLQPQSRQQVQLFPFQRRVGRDKIAAAGPNPLSARVRFQRLDGPRVVDEGKAKFFPFLGQRLFFMSW